MILSLRHGERRSGSDVQENMKRRGKLMVRFVYIVVFHLIRGLLQHYTHLWFMWPKIYWHEHARTRIIKRIWEHTVSHSEILPTKTKSNTVYLKLMILNCCRVEIVRILFGDGVDLGVSWWWCCVCALTNDWFELFQFDCEQFIVSCHKRSE